MAHKHKHPKRWLAALALLAWAVVAPAQAQAEESRAEQPKIQVSLISEASRAAPGGSVFLALHMLPEPGWHTYWENPGDAGLTTEVEWTLPGGVTASPLQFPYPDTFPLGEMINYGYEGPHTLLTRLDIPADWPPGESIPVQMQATWLVCKDVCIPGNATLRTRIDTGETMLLDADHQALFLKARQRIPQQVNWPARFEVRDGRLRFAVEPPAGVLADVQRASFYPRNIELVDHGASQNIGWDEQRLTLVQPLNDFFETMPETVSGVLVVHTKAGVSAVDIAAGPGQVSPLPARVSGGIGDGAGGSLALILLMAFGGGLILNLMPCVFPVLSLKAISLAKSGGKALSEQRMHGVVYTAGVVLSFLAVAAVLLALRAGGEAIGWGFQLQSPWFVALMSYLLFALGLSLSGLVNFGGGLMGMGANLADRGGYSGSFFTGVVAVVVASPCTAPFMGSAIGYAVTQPTPTALGVFASLGLGMASPFLLFAFVPALARSLPKPGPWMNTFKQFMAFPLYITVVWLVWVLGRQTSINGMAIVLAGLVLLAMALWLWGRHQNRGQAHWPELALLAVAIVGALVLLRSPLLMPSTGDATATARSDDQVLPWQPYSQERLDELRAAGQPVFINMTADWCITCLANERVALHNAEVKAALEQAGVALLKGDWTNGDARITAKLAEFGRNGVPLYVIYPADPAAAPVVLPQLLTPGDVLEALAEL